MINVGRLIILTFMKCNFGRFCAVCGIVTLVEVTHVGDCGRSFRMRMVTFDVIAMSYELSNVLYLFLGLTTQLRYSFTLNLVFNELRKLFLPLNLTILAFV